jgi:uncharacterized surface protein with fasciclin (FAS1) repeats
MEKIIKTAIANGSLKTLVTAIKAAGLAETLSRPGPFTIFAPNDEVFAKLPKGAVEGLLKDIPKLKKLPAYHVVVGKAPGAGVMKLSSAKTVQGQKVTITLDKRGSR